MRKNYFVILNNTITARENSLANAVQKLNADISELFPEGDIEQLNYQTVYTWIRQVRIFKKIVYVKLFNIDTPIYITIQELDV